MFYDLNVPYTPGSTELPRTVALLDELGYNVIALSTTLSGKLPTTLTCAIPPAPFPTPPNLRVLTRCTLHLSDASQNHRLALLTSLYDLLALRPTTEKLLQQAVSSLDCDLISLDFSQRLPFVLRHKLVGAALQRGLCFEICYAASITDAAARRNLVANAAALVRATRGGRGVVVSSEARRALAVRAPADVVNLATLWGLGQERGREAVGALARGVVVAAEMRRRSVKGVVEVVEDGEGEGGRKAREERKAEGKADAKNKTEEGGGKRKGPPGEKEGTLEAPLSKRAKKRAAKAARAADVDKPAT